MGDGGLASTARSIPNGSLISSQISIPEWKGVDYENVVKDWQLTISAISSSSSTR